MLLVFTTLSSRRSNLMAESATHIYTTHMHNSYYCNILATHTHTHMPTPTQHTQTQHKHTQHTQHKL